MHQPTIIRKPAQHARGRPNTAPATRPPPTGRRMVRLLQTAKAPVVDQAARTVALSFSSAAEVEMGSIVEVLSHAPGAADLSRLNAGGSLLFNHDMDDVLGVVESASIGGDGKGRAVVRFGKDDRGEWAMQQVADGILRNVSFAYIVDNYSEGADARTYIAERWTALEISIVTVPADASVGVGRSFQSKEKVMDQDNTTTETSSPTMNRRQRQNSAEAVQAERERVTGIQALCRKWGLQDSMENYIEDGTRLEDVRADVLEHINRTPRRAVGGGDRRDDDLLLGMSPEEVGRFSIVRAINAQITGDWSRAGFERDCSRAAQQKLGRQTQGFLVPEDVLQRGQWQQRAPYAVGAVGTGGAAVATNLMGDQFVAALRNSSQVINAGAQVLSGLVGNVDIPRQTTTTSTYWVPESGPITEAEATFDKVSLRPKTLGALSKMSRLMLLQATPSIELLVRGDLLAQMGLGIDLAALSGSGASNQPTGVVNTAGVGSVVMGANGSAITLDALVALETALSNSNAPLDGRAYLLNTKTIGTLKNLKATTGTYLWTDSAPGQRSGTPLQFNGYPVFSTNQARSNLTKGSSSGVCSELFYGAWNELLIGQWGALEIVVNPYDTAGFTTGDVLVRAMQTIDIAVRHPVSFAFISDALTP